MKSQRSAARLKPLFIGRMTRMVFGIGTLVVVAVAGPSSLTTWGMVGLIVLGVSFLVGGVAGNPGCELTAIGNLLVPKGKRSHFF